MLRIAVALASTGHQVDIYTMSWEGEVPHKNITPHVIKIKGLFNHRRYASFIQKSRFEIQRKKYDLVVGFNRMTDLDVYFVADPCYLERTQKRSFLYKLSGRYRWFSQTEREVFSDKARCEILLLAEKEKADFQRWYNTPDHRFHLLPPYLSPHRMALLNKIEMRSKIRNEFGWAEQDQVLLTVGSGFRVKGLDRSLLALSELPQELRSTTKLLVVGQDNAKIFLRQVADLGLQKNVCIVGGRNDIPQLMQGSDLLIHPARAELAGHVLLEAMASGLPVLVTDVCGYASHIANAKSGIVLSSPFEQVALNRVLQDMLESDQRSLWQSNGVQYASEIFSNNDGFAEARLLINMVNDRYGEKTISDKL